MCLDKNFNMENQHENYQQQKITGDNQQTVIVDPSQTAETDELNPSFNGVPDPDDDPEVEDENNENLDGEGIDEENAGASPLIVETGTDDTGLNHDQQDDLSLNTDEDSVL